MLKYLTAIVFFPFLAYSSAYAEQGRVVLVPESTVNSMTEQQKAEAIEYARQNGIKWRIVKDHKGAPK